METSSLKILAIDDKQGNLRALKAIVADAFPDAVVSTALTGSQGIDLALAEDPNVILLDIVMPEWDGFEVCRRLKADERLRHIPVVFLTASSASRESRIEALSAGGEAFLAKPVDTAELAAEIKAMAKIDEAGRTQRQERARLAALVEERTAKLEKEIVEHLRSVDALRESEAKYRALVENVNDIVYSADSKGILTFVNSVAERILGYKPEEMIGRPFAKFIYPADLPALMERFRLVLSGDIRPDDYRLVTKTGDIRWVRSSSRPIVEYGKVVGIQGVITDITDRKAAEEAHEESESRFRSLVESSINHVFLLDLQGRYLLSNTRVLSRGFKNAAELVGRRIEDVYPTSVARDYLRHFRQVVRTGKATTFEHDLPLASGIQHHRDILFPVERHGKVLWVGGICSDITRHKLAEERARTFSRKLLTVREEEKKRVSSALHHDLGSLAVGLSAYLDAIEEDVRSGKAQKVLKWIRGMRKTFDRSVVRLKEVAVALRPPELDVLGLCAALRHHFAQVSEHGGVRIHFTETLGQRRVPDNTAIVVFRIVQETLTNAVRHGHAKKVGVRLTALKRQLSLAISSDGRAFHRPREDMRGVSHLGLHMMEEMAASAGGTFEIDSRGKDGTIVRVSLPIEKSEVGSRKSEVGSRKSEVGSRKSRSMRAR